MLLVASLIRSKLLTTTLVFEVFHVVGHYSSMDGKERNQLMNSFFDTRAGTPRPVSRSFRILGRELVTGKGLMLRMPRKPSPCGGREAQSVMYPPKGHS